MHSDNRTDHYHVDVVTIVINVIYSVHVTCASISVTVLPLVESIVLVIMLCACVVRVLYFHPAILQKNYHFLVTINRSMS